MTANDLKYRYVKMRGEIKEKELSELETIFQEDKYKAIRDTIRNRVERYETGVKIRVEQLEQGEIKERKVQKLLEEANGLRSR